MSTVKRQTGVSGFPGMASNILQWIFQAPKPASYSVNSFPGELCWLDDGKIPCLWLPSAGSRKVLLYLHGNASDLGMERAFMIRMRDFFRVNVLGMEFPGYGPITVHWQIPSEQLLFARVVKVCLIVGEQWPIDGLVVVGYSLGSSAALHVAANPPTPRLQGAVLWAPFSSLHELIDDLSNNGLIAWGAKYLVPNQAFRNVDLIARVRIPLALFHGSGDRLIPKRHSEQLSRAAPNAQIVIVQGLTHNITATPLTESELLTRTKTFLDGAFLVSPSVAVTASDPVLPASLWIRPVMPADSSPHRYLLHPDRDPSILLSSRSATVLVIVVPLVLVFAIYLLRQCRKLMTPPSHYVPPP